MDSPQKGGMAIDCQANNKSYQFDNRVFEISRQCKNAMVTPLHKKKAILIRKTTALLVFYLFMKGQKINNYVFFCSVSISKFTSLHSGQVMDVRTHSLG